MSIELNKVIVAREYNARQDDTATKIVINAAEISKFGDTQLTDVLKRLPGITVQGTDVRMRGLGNGYTQILIDGDRAPTGFSIDQIPPNMIERIEIIRAATAEFGTQSIAGTVNIVMKKKVALAQREIRAQYEKSDFYLSPRLSFLMSDKDETFSYSASGFVYQYYDDHPYTETVSASNATGNQTRYWLSEGRQKGMGTRQAGADPRLMWNLGGGDTLAWQIRLRVLDNAFTANSRYAVVRGTPVIYASSDFQGRLDGNVMRTDLNWVRKFAEGATLDTKVSLGHVNVVSNDFNRGYNTDYLQTLERTFTVLRTVQEFGVTGKLSIPVLDGHALVTGWDTGWIRSYQNSSGRDKLFAGVTPIADIDDQLNASVLKMAAFLQDEWNVNEDWSIYFGLRWEGVNTTSSGNTFTTATNHSSVWSPLAQTLYKLPDREGEQIRFALTRTYKAPSPNSLIPTRFLTLDNQPTSPDNQGNPDLRPELATGIDIAAEKFWKNGASTSLSFAVRNITQYNRAELGLINGRWVIMPVNDGTAYSRSLEFDVKAPIQKIYPTSPAIDLRINLNRNWSAVEAVPGPDNLLDKQTPFSGTFGLDYRTKGGEFSCGTSFSFRAGGLTRTAITQSAYQTARRDLEMYALWKVTPKTQMRLTLSNILRTEYVEGANYFDGTGSVESRQTNNPAKLLIRFGLEMKL